MPSFGASSIVGIEIFMVRKILWNGEVISGVFLGDFPGIE